MRATPETYLRLRPQHQYRQFRRRGPNRLDIYKAPADVPLDDFALYGQWLAAAEYVHHAVTANPPGDSVGLH